MRDGSKLLLDEGRSVIETVQRGQPYMGLKSDRCRLVPSEVGRVELIRRPFTMVTEEERLPIERIARTLRREGVPTSRGSAWSAQCSGVWSFTTVRNMLVNRERSTARNSLFVGNERAGRTASILSSLTSTCRRHAIDPQRYFTRVLVNLPGTPVSRLGEWLPDAWKRRGTPPPG